MLLRCRVGLRSLRYRNDRRRTLQLELEITREASSDAMLAAILFDLDGTLVNTDVHHFQIWQELLADRGVTIDRQFYDAHMVGHRNEAIVRDVLSDLPFEAGMQLARHKEAKFRDRAAQMERLTGLDRLLTWIEARSLATAVVTNAPRDNAELMLTALELSDRFDTLVVSDELPHGKPHPLPYQTALERLAIAPETAIAFEDTPLGIRSAVAAGVQTVGMATTHAPSVLQEAGAEFAIADFTAPELWTWLDERASLSPA